MAARMNFAIWFLPATASIRSRRSTGRRTTVAAWLGLVPAEHSTGGKQTLLGISKRGNRYVRRLIIHGARSCFLHLNRANHALGGGLSALEARTDRNKARRRLGKQAGPDHLGYPDEARHRLSAVEGGSDELTVRPQNRLQGKVMTKRLIDHG